MADYVTIQLPTDLVEVIDQAIQIRKKYGYRSRAEFVTSSVREKLQRMGMLD